MDSRVHAAIAQGHGLATAAGLAAMGIERRAVAVWVRRGLLVPVRRGVYTTAELWAAWDVHRERPLALIRAVQLGLAVEHVLSHDSAAIVHRLPLIDARTSAVHVTVRHTRGARTQSGVHHHGAAFGSDEVVEVDGFHVLGIARTVADIARWHGYSQGLVAADGAMQLGVSRAQLGAAAAPMTGWPHSLVVDAVIQRADPGAESAGETLTRELLAEAGLVPVETQFPVAVPSGIVWADIRVGRHLVEFDGRLKYRGAGAEQAVWDERVRQREMCAQGFGMSRVVWADLWGDARARAIARIQAEASVTAARFGTALTPAQAEVAARFRGQRYRAS